MTGLGTAALAGPRDVNLVLGVALPLLIVFPMFVAGVSLTRVEFASVARHPRIGPAKRDVRIH